MEKCSFNFISSPYRIDKKLYKYFSNTKYAMDCISKRRIHLDDPATFNDPFDVTYTPLPYSTLTSSESEAEVVQKIIGYITNYPQQEKYGSKRKIVLSVLVDNLDLFSDISLSFKKPCDIILRDIYNKVSPTHFSFTEFQEMVDIGYVEDIRAMRLRCKASCFSEVNDSILMWSYYANSHEGVCIEFDLSRLDPTYTISNQILKHITKVQYSPVRPNPFRTPFEDATYNFIFTKSDVWEHEHEWRITCDTEEEYLPFDCISGVYFGARFDKTAPKYRELIRSMKKYDDIKIYTAKLSTTKYALEFEEDSGAQMLLYMEKSKRKKIASPV